MNHHMTCGCVALAAFTAGAAANTAPNTQVHSEKVGGAMSAFDESINFPQFDTLGGTRQLTGVELFYEIETSARVSGENDAPFGAPNFAIVLNGFIQVDFGDLNGQDDILGMAETPVSASDGVPGSGTDFMDFGAFIRTTRGAIAKSTDLSAYVGAGTVEASIFSEAAFHAMGTSDATIYSDNFSLSGTVGITYTWENVPAPGAVAAFGLLGLGAARRRR